MRGEEATEERIEGGEGEDAAAVFSSFFVASSVIGVLLLPSAAFFFFVDSGPSPYSSNSLCFFTAILQSKY